MARTGKATRMLARRASEGKRIPSLRAITRVGKAPRMLARRASEGMRNPSLARRANIFAVIVICLCGDFPLHAQDDDQFPEQRQIPVVGRPTSGFYNAAGMDVKLKAEASPTKLATNEWLTFTVTVTGLLNASDVQKPSLNEISEFKPFQIDESTKLDVPFDAGHSDHRVFKYKLRPSTERLTLIPEIDFHYYDPKRVTLPDRPQDKFPKALSNAVPIVVTRPAEPPSAPPTPLVIPGFAEHLASGNALSAGQSSIPPWLWFAALVAPPMLAVGWVMAWRHLYPDVAKLRLLKRHRAVRLALAALKAIKRSDERAAVQTAEIVSRYLHERFDLPLSARTPIEITNHLRTLGLSTERVALSAAFFRDCDALRFAPGHAVAEEIAHEAERLIIAMEGEG